MGTQSYKQITDFLGATAHRYFASGFKHFNTQVATFCLQEKKLAGTLRVNYSGPARPRSEVTHLGSMEYMAMAFTLAEYALVYVLGLSANQVGRSFPRYCQIKLSKVIPVTTIASIPFQCQLLDNKRCTNALNVHVSTLSIQLGTARIRLEIDHPGATYCRLDPHAEWPVNISSMYKEGYKLSHNLLSNVVCNLGQHLCTADIFRADDYCINRRGMSSARSTVLPTDVLSISGQLMQVLLYNLLETNREACPNIWLRSLTMHFGRPLWHPNYAAAVHFCQTAMQSLGNDVWHTVALTSQIGNIHSQFHIAHQII